MNSAPVPTQMFNEEELWGRQLFIYSDPAAIFDLTVDVESA